MKLNCHVVQDYEGSCPILLNVISGEQFFGGGDDDDDDDEDDDDDDDDDDDGDGDDDGDDNKILNVKIILSPLTITITNDLTDFLQLTHSSNHPATHSPTQSLEGTRVFSLWICRVLRFIVV